MGTEQKRKKFTQQEIPMAQNRQQGFQMPPQQNFESLLNLINQGQQALLKQDQMPVSRISKDQHTQRGTPGLDQWHKNNQDAPAAGTYQPDGKYGQVGQDIYAGPNPAMQSAQPAEHPVNGFMGLLAQLFGGSGQQGAPQGNPQSHQVAPPPQQQMGPPRPQMGAMQQPPEVLQTQEGFNTPPIGPLQGPPNFAALMGPPQGLQSMQQQSPMGPMQGPPAPRRDAMGNLATTPNIDSKGFVGLTAPFQTGMQAFHQGQQQDPTVPLLNLGKGFLAGSRKSVQDIINSYR